MLLKDQAEYNRIYNLSITDYEKFWDEQAKAIHWDQPYTKVKEVSFQKPVSIKWFLNGKLNISYNCIDRHLPTMAQQAAFIWEPDNINGESKKITYQQLHDHVCQLAHVLTDRGVKKGDRVTIYLPMVPEAVYSLLACARIGAIHSVIFAGFSPDSIVDRIEDGQSDFVITADEGRRMGKVIPLKQNVTTAISKLKEAKIRHVLTLKITNSETIPWNAQTDLWWHDEMKNKAATYPPVMMDAEDPLFILYTSGSTGKPKGVLHTTGGYLVFSQFTHETVFQYKKGEVYWCTADVGWVTGHTYIVYGPLANGATSVIFEGVPNYPTASRFWQVIDKHQVNIFYTAPTAIRALMREGDSFVTSSSRKSLRVLGTVGEPINPEAWNWYNRVVGNGRCPIVDTWWQTETGGVLISPIAGITKTKPGSATLPMFGIKPEILTVEGKKLEGECEGVLAISDSWPGQMRTVYRNHQRFEETYFSTYPGYYFSGDGCKRDADGYYWITGRVDDVINVSGHRLGTAEIESALVLHPSVAEAAVVGYPNEIKGQGIYAYVTLKSGISETEDLRKDLIKQVRTVISPIATPDIIQWAPALPKTRSGKIMRRILRKIAENQIDNVGDTSTLADPSVVKNLIERRMNQ